MIGACEQCAKALREFIDASTAADSVVRRAALMLCDAIIDEQLQLAALAATYKRAKAEAADAYLLLLAAIDAPCSHGDPTRADNRPCTCIGYLNGACEAHGDLIRGGEPCRHVTLTSVHKIDGTIATRCASCGAEVVR